MFPIVTKLCFPLYNLIASEKPNHRPASLQTQRAEGMYQLQPRCWLNPLSPASSPPLLAQCTLQPLQQGR